MLVMAGKITYYMPLPIEADFVLIRAFGIERLPVYASHINIGGQLKEHSSAAFVEHGFYVLKLSSIGNKVRRGLGTVARGKAIGESHAARQHKAHSK